DAVEEPLVERFRVAAQQLARGSPNGCGGDGLGGRGAEVLDGAMHEVERFVARQALAGHLAGGRLGGPGRGRARVRPAGGAGGRAAQTPAGEMTGERLT